MDSKRPISLGSLMSYFRGKLPHVVDRAMLPYAVARNETLELLPVTYRNEKIAIDILKEAQGKSCLVHCDVDMDGVAAGNIFYKAFKFEGYFKNIELAINPKRTHGIELITDSNGVLCLNGYGPIESLRGSLLVIVDSSSDNLKEIRKLPCDVLVLDHHAIEYDLAELTGDTEEGRYVIINSMVMDELHPDLQGFNGGVYQTSGAQVVFEILVKSNILPKFIEDNIRHWVTVSLFSDVVDTSGPQAQRYIADWYVNAMSEFKGIISQFPYAGLNKSFILGRLASTVNGAIRAGEPEKALEACILRPNKLAKLREEIDPIKRKMQEMPLPYKEFPGLLAVKVCDTELEHAYKGMRAGGFVDLYSKPAFVYHRCTYAEPNGEPKDYLTGSFRGLKGTINYLEYFQSLGVHAKGHGNAFGLTIPAEGAAEIFKSLPPVYNQDNIDIHERLKNPHLMVGYYVLCGEIGDMYKDLEGIYENGIIIHEDSLNLDILELIGKLNNRLTADEISFKIIGQPINTKVYAKYAKWLLGEWEMRTFGENMEQITPSRSVRVTFENGYPKLTA